jgi:uncharacterized protein YgbK (DUF1537 family)
MSNDLLLTYYGDDFTGSTDAMEALTLQGVPTILFLQTPDDDMLAEADGFRALGIAGISRSQSPEWMSRELPQVFSALKRQKAAFCHYKVCSTFDSSPQVGSIGRALEIGQKTFESEFVPLLVGAPVLRRYTLFGNLFAAHADVTYRIDRHPVMRTHPSTPMHEADLRQHLAAQTDQSIALVDILTLQSDVVDNRVDALLAESPDVLLFDVLDEASQAEVGRLLWERRATDTTFIVGSSGVEYALAAHWQTIGLANAPSTPPTAAPVDRLVVVSGSCSSVTENQIRWACENSFTGIALDVQRLVSDDGAAAVLEAYADAEHALRDGRSVVLYTALGSGAGFAELTPGNAIEFNDSLGARVGELLRTLCERNELTRAVVAGGDTSGHAVRQLDMYALTLAAPLVPGGPLCRIHSNERVFDGIEIVLKGGQIGGEDFFRRVRDGGM